MNEQNKRFDNLGFHFLRPPTEETDSLEKKEMESIATNTIPAVAASAVAASGPVPAVRLSAAAAATTVVVVVLP